MNITKSDKNIKYTCFSTEFQSRVQLRKSSKQNGRGTQSSFVACFGQSKIRAIRLISRGVKKCGANRSDVEKRPNTRTV